MISEKKLDFYLDQAIAGEVSTGVVLELIAEVVRLRERNKTAETILRGYLAASGLDPNAFDILGEVSEKFLANDRKIKKESDK